MARICLLFLSLLLLCSSLAAPAPGTMTAGSTLGVKWYAGFLNVPVRGCSGGASQPFSQVFYWYFPSTTANTNTMTVYLEGGPGIPGTFSVFYGPGPFRLQSLVPPDWTPPLASQYQILLNNNTWLAQSGMLFLDNPIGVGFSQFNGNASTLTCGNPYPTNISDVAKDLVIALDNFQFMFPQVNTYEWHLVGHSYGGKYVLGLANALLAASPPFKVGSVIIVDGLVDTVIQAQSWLPYALQMGIFSSGQVAVYEPDLQQIIGWIQAGNYSAASDAYYDLILNMSTTAAIWEYNAFLVDMPPPLGELPASFGGYSIVVNSSEWRSALGISPVAMPTYGTAEGAFYVAFYNDVAVPYPQLLMPVLQAGLPVLVINGAADWIVTARGTDQWLAAATGGASFENAPMAPWLVPSIYPTSLWPYNATGGSFKRHPTLPLTLLVLRDAGHFAEHDQPLHAQQAFSQWLAGGGSIGRPEKKRG